MKITIAKLKKLIREATGGDGRLELVDARNWGHLEQGSTYMCKTGRDKVIATFVGWFDESGVELPHEHPSNNPEGVQLKFADTKDGFEWEAYWSGDSFCAGSSADKLFVKES